MTKWTYDRSIDTRERDPDAEVFPGDNERCTERDTGGGRCWLHADHDGPHMRHFCGLDEQTPQGADDYDLDIRWNSHRDALGNDAVLGQRRRLIFGPGRFFGEEPLARVWAVTVNGTIDIPVYAVNEGEALHIASLVWPQEWETTGLPVPADPATFSARRVRECIEEWGPDTLPWGESTEMPVSEILDATNAIERESGAEAALRYGVHAPDLRAMWDSIPEDDKDPLSTIASHVTEYESGAITRGHLFALIVSDDHETDPKFYPMPVALRRLPKRYSDELREIMSRLARGQKLADALGQLATNTPAFMLGKAVLPPKYWRELLARDRATDTDADDSADRDSEGGLPPRGQP